MRGRVLFLVIGFVAFWGCSSSDSELSVGSTSQALVGDGGPDADTDTDTDADTDTDTGTDVGINPLCPGTGGAYLQDTSDAKCPDNR